jgi:hypothetical protein
LSLTRSSGTPRAAGRWLFINAIGVLALFWGLAIAELYEDRDSRIAQEVKNLDNLAEAFRELTLERFNIFGSSLTRISDSFSAENLADPGSAPRLHEILRNARAASKGVLQFLLIDETGVVRHSSEALAPEPRRVAFEETLASMRAAAAGTTEIYATRMGTYDAADQR